VVVPSGYDDGRYSITLVTTLTRDPPFFVSVPREGSNNAADFLLFVMDLITDNFFDVGDFLILDNASVHKAAPLFDHLQFILAGVGVTLVFLPTYSPELNPCELIFAQVKRFIRTRRASGDPFWTDIVRGCARVRYENVLRYYIKCIRRF